MSLFKREQLSLGVDIGAAGIKLVELRKAKGRPQLWTYALVDEHLDIQVETHGEKTATDLLREDRGELTEVGAGARAAPPAPPKDSRLEAYSEWLSAAVKQARVKSRRATASLPVSSVFHAVITLPKVPEKELGHHVRAKVKKMLPRPIDEMQVVHQLIPQSPLANRQDWRVLVTAAPRDVVQFYTAVFQRAGLDLEELETEAFALERALVGRDQTTAMVVDIGARRTNFFIIDQGLPITHRSIHLGGNNIHQALQRELAVDEEQAAVIEADLAGLPGARVPGALFNHIFDPIIKEIQYSFDLFLHQSGNEQRPLEKIILTGGAAVFPSLAAAIQSSFPVRVFVGDPWARVVYQHGLKRILDPLGPRMSVAIGLALRGMV